MAAEVKIWLIADTHFFHNKMIEYCNRPEDFNKRIQKGLRNISYGQILIHLGDISIGDNTKAHYRYIWPLPCRKWLIRGNHDRKSTTWYLNHGWDFVGKTISLNWRGKVVLFSHVPQPDGDFDINIHGHFHNNNHRYCEPQYTKILTDKNYLFSLEDTNYQPVTLERFLNGVGQRTKNLEKGTGN